MPPREDETHDDTTRPDDTPRSVDTKPEAPQATGRRGEPPPATTATSTRPGFDRELARPAATPTRSNGLDLDVAELSSATLANELAKSFSSQLPPPDAKTQPSPEDLDSVGTLLGQVVAMAKICNMKGGARVTLHPNPHGPGFVQLSIRQGSAVHAQSLDRAALADSRAARVKASRKVVAPAPKPLAKGPRFAGAATAAPAPAPSHAQKGSAAPQKADPKAPPAKKPAPAARDTIPPPARR